MKQSYFSHDRDARSDPKIIKLRTAYGMEGYGIYFAILEMLAADNEHKLPYDNDQFDAIAYDLHTDVSIQAFVDFCVDKGLFDKDSEWFWSAALIRRMEETDGKANRRKENASAAAKARWNKRKVEQDAVELEMRDEEWLKVIKAYEAELGLFPTGTTCEKLYSFYEDMGADVMCEAIKQTNKGQAAKPALYLQKVLNAWSDQGVKTVEQARAASIDHDRRVKARQTQENQPQQPVIRGKFY